MSKDDGGGVPVFGALMAEAMAGAPRFGHREHVHLTWLAVRRCGVPEAVRLVSDGIQRTARYAGGAAEVPRDHQPGLGRTGRVPRGGKRRKLLPRLR